MIEPRKKYRIFLKYFTLKFFFAFCGCILNYFFPKILLKGPIYVGWNITFKCNCNCEFCRSRDFVGNKELNTKQCIKAIKQIAKSGICLLSITGGEPLLRKDLFEIIREGKKQGLFINLITNGYFLEEKAEIIAESGIDIVTVSIDSLDKKEHDFIRNCPGLLERTKRGIEKLQKIKNKPEIIITSVVNKKNYKDLPGFIKYWTKKNVMVTLQPIQENSRKSIFKIKNKNLLFAESDKKDFYFSLKNILKTGYEKNFYDFFFNKQLLSKRYKCFAGFFMIQIDAFGNVYSCPEFTEYFGTLKKESLRNILKSKKTQSFKQNIKQNKNKCFCWYKCTGIINYYLTNLIKLKAYNEKSIIRPCGAHSFRKNKNNNEACRKI
jgi:MoaA/NifB/PqqE/SkfB family radical SAM enzyme